MSGWSLSPCKERFIRKDSSKCCLACLRSPACRLTWPSACSVAAISVCFWLLCSICSSSRRCSRVCSQVSVFPPAISSGRLEGSKSPWVHVTSVTRPAMVARKWDGAVGCVNTSDSSGKTSTGRKGCKSSSTIRVALMICLQADRQFWAASSLAMVPAQWQTAANTLKTLSPSLISRS